MFKNKGIRGLVGALVLAATVSGCAALKKDPTIVTNEEQKAWQCVTAGFDKVLVADDKVAAALALAASCGVQVTADFILHLLGEAEAAHARAAKAGAVKP
jgi:uncharacterized low-complexity protein